MAKIIKVASSTSTPRIASQFKTSRNSTTNPFKYQNFEGNTLDISAFADVFESSAVKETNKMKLIAASVAGSMHKVGSRIAEPIINFVNRVREGVTSVWDYAKNTNISDINMFKGMNENINNFKEWMNKPIEIPGTKAIDNAISGFKTHIGAINENVLDWGKDISSKWSEIISKLHTQSKISADMPVSELEALWKSEIALTSVEEAA